jgi:hypothetical protein
MVCIIEVGVYGGCVQWIRGIPEGVEVQVNDYDIDGVDRDRLSSDDNGRSCIIVTYASSSQDDQEAT